MLRQVCKGKIQHASVTRTDLTSTWSITIDATLMDAANILQFEMVQVTNASNGSVWNTYAIAGDSGSGVLCPNGPLARHFHPGDKVGVLSLAYVDDKGWSLLEPTEVYVDDKNHIVSVVKHKLVDLNVQYSSEIH